MTHVFAFSLDPGAFFFYLLAAVVVVSATGVAILPNILYAALSLLGTLGGVAGLYLLLGADFLGVAQLLIYVGGILVLILFAVLLTTRIGEVRVHGLSSGLLAGAPAAVGLIAVLSRILWGTSFPLTESVIAPSTQRVGDALLREALLPFEFVSLTLLMALVGAMVIARRAARQSTIKNTGKKIGGHESEPSGVVRARG
jgi:NAD(P)H-quinone oxidoreductase subunit 6